jgi:acetolactate synthase small subunit
LGGRGRRISNSSQAGHHWLTLVILATEEEEISRITVQSQPRQIVLETLFKKNPSQKKGWWSVLKCRL